VRRGATEDVVEKLRDYEDSDLPERTKAALRLADKLSLESPPSMDEDFYGMLGEHFTEDEILDLGMTAAFMSGWQQFNEAFGIVPDNWREGGPKPWEAVVGREEPT
jgi:alkylhydroperoxidase family enzyme